MIRQIIGWSILTILAFLIIFLMIWTCTWMYFLIALGIILGGIGFFSLIIFAVNLIIDK